jgi:hypothetical protein
MFRVISLTVFATIPLIVPRSASAGPDWAPIESKEVKIRAELVHKVVLPYEPVRIRMLVLNVSGALFSAENAPELFGCRLKRPGNTSFDVDGYPTPWAHLEAHGDDWGGGPGEPTLLPGKSYSGSRAFQFETFPWGAGPHGLDSGPNMRGLVDPGEYEIEVVYWVKNNYKTRRPEFAKAVLTFNVIAPLGPDKKAAEMLRDDPDLTANLFCSKGDPAPGSIPKIKRLLDLYPKKRLTVKTKSAMGPSKMVLVDVCAESSYALFARFALARFYGHQEGGEAAAQKEIAAIKYRSFAYQPNALLYQRIYEYDHWGHNPRVRANMKESERILNEHFSDTAEFIGDYKRVLYDRLAFETSNETPPTVRDLWPRFEKEWYQFRIKSPKPYEDQPPEDGLVESDDGEQPRNGFLASTLTFSIFALTLVLVITVAARQRRWG